MADKLGYLFVDHRASPGLTPEQARLNGYDPKLAAEGKLFEADTMRCAHCPNVVIRNPDRIRARSSCLKCGDKYICDNCAFLASQPDYVHKPFQAKLDETYENLLKLQTTTSLDHLFSKDA